MFMDYFLVQGAANFNFANFFNAPPPTWSRTGALKSFFQLDVMKLASELYVVNDAGQWKIFQLKDFTGSSSRAADLTALKTPQEAPI